MKRFLFSLLLILLSVLPAQGQMLMGGMDGGAAGVCSPTSTAGCTDATHTVAGATVLLCEDFDGAVACGSGVSNCRNTWSDTFVNNFGDFSCSSTPCPLEGTYSLSNAANTIGGSHDITASGTVYAYGRIRPTDLTTDAERFNNAIGVYDATGTVGCLAGFYNSGTGMKWQVFDGANYASTSIVPSTSITHHVWIKYVKGATSTCDIYISTTGVKGASLAQVVGTNNVDVTFAWIASGADNSYDIDRVIVSTSAIGDCP